MNTKSGKKSLTISELLPILFFAGRILLFLALIPNDIHGLGDFPIYYDIAAIPGFPFFQYWSEYPPVYAWTIELIYLLSNANQFIFDFILYLLLTIVGSVSIWLVAKISEILFGEEKETLWRSIVYFGFLAFNSYTWWYFDLIPVTFMLLAIYAVLKGKDVTAGLWLGIGILTKWFPILLLPAIFRFKERKNFLKIAGIAIGLTIIVWGIHLLVSPNMTVASLQSQPSRSSWQTIWALIDGNMTTGAFVPMEWRSLFDAAVFSHGKPAVISPWLTLLIFAGIGIMDLFKLQTFTKNAMTIMMTITWLLFLLWSPGWSSQWVLYLIPFFALVFPQKLFLAFSFFLLMLTFLEWPTFLGHHVYSSLWIIAPVRTIFFIGILLQCRKIIKQN